MDQRVKGLEEEAKDAAAFYALQLEKAANNRAFVESQLSHLVKHHPDNKIVTPKGTAFFSSSTRRTWPEDAELLSWAQTNIPAAVTKKDGPVSVSKKDILEAFKAGTVTPPAGFREEKVTKLSLRAFATPAPGTENEELKPIIHVAQTGEGSW